MLHTQQVPFSLKTLFSLAVCVCCAAVRAFMRICQSNQGQQGTCGFFGSGGYLLYEITEGQVSFTVFFAL
jgi:hypothetical protein